MEPVVGIPVLRILPILPAGMRNGYAKNIAYSNCLWLTFVKFSASLSFIINLPFKCRLSGCDFLIRTLVKLGWIKKLKGWKSISY